KAKADDLLINPEPFVEATPDALHLLTFCVLVLRNGFTVTGESACASPENFDPEIGRKIARENAVNKIWMLEGYLLKQRLSEK
ncbi:Gp49 family protein, partial [Klebsiella pneumoniae]